MLRVFPGGSDGKESASNAGDLGLIPGIGRSLGEGEGYYNRGKGIKRKSTKVH